MPGWTSNDKPNGSIVRFDVQGEEFWTDASNLISPSEVDDIFSTHKKENFFSHIASTVLKSGGCGSQFSPTAIVRVDRSPLVFSEILFFIRHGWIYSTEISRLEVLAFEAEYYGLDNLHSLASARLAEARKCGNMFPELKMLSADVMSAPKPNTLSSTPPRSTEGTPLTCADSRPTTPHAKLEQNDKHTDTRRTQELESKAVHDTRIQPVKNVQNAMLNMNTIHDFKDRYHSQGPASSEWMNDCPPEPTPLPEDYIKHILDTSQPILNITDEDF